VSATACWVAQRTAARRDPGAATRAKMRNRTRVAQRSEPSTWSNPTRSASCLSTNSTAKMGPQTGCSSPVKPSNSPLRARRRASIRSGAQELRLARVRVRTLSPSRKDSRKRMAGGELRLGTAVIYMSIYPYNDTCLDMLICPAYAVSKNSDHLYEEAADVTGMPN